MKPISNVKPVITEDTTNEFVTRQKLGINLPNRGQLTMPQYTKLSPVEINGVLIPEGPLRMEVKIEDLKIDGNTTEFTIVARRKMTIRT